MGITDLKEFRKTWNKRKYHDRLQLGLCPLCGTENKTKYIICFKCRCKNAARMREKYDRKKVNLCI